MRTFAYGIKHAIFFGGSNREIRGEFQLFPGMSIANFWSQSNKIDVGICSRDKEGKYGGLLLLVNMRRFLFFNLKCSVVT